MRKPKINYTKRKLEEIEKLAGLGLTLPMIASWLGLSKSGFEKNRKREPRIDEALERGRALAQEAVADALFNKALEGDVQAIKWWEMTRAGRSGKAQIETEHTHYVVEIPAPIPSGEEWEKRVDD